jgi:hypothetical protein
MNEEEKSIINDKMIAWIIYRLEEKKLLIKNICFFFILNKMDITTQS